MGLSRSTPGDACFEARLHFYSWMGGYHEIEYGLEQADPARAADAIAGLERRLGAAGLL